MTSLIKGRALPILLGVGLAGTAAAQTIIPAGADIPAGNMSTDTIVQSGFHHLLGQVYVMPTFSLTIEPARSSRALPRAAAASP